MRLMSAEILPRLEQVYAILEKDLMRVLESSTDQHERRARRADKLSEILAELEEAYGVGDKAKHFLQGNRAQRGGSSGGGGGAGGGGGRTMASEVWRRTLAKIHEVAAEQLAAASEGERRGSLEVYCDDAHAHCLAMLAQALEHAGELLSAHDRDTYEVHVALRTIRTIEQCERLQPARPIEWRMGRNEAYGQAEGDDTGSGRGGEDGVDSDTEWVSLSESRRRKVDSQMLASFHRRKDALNSFVKGGSERSMKRTLDHRSKSKVVSQEMRERIDRIYNPAKYASKAVQREQLRTVEGYLKALDLDGDGLVSREEYAAAFHVMDIDGDGMLSKEEYFLGGALPFKKLDKDGDGVITFEEFQKGYDIMDKDNDGQLTRAEFMVLFKREAPKVENTVEGYLKALDLDGDGFVSREEYEAAFRVMDIDGDGMLSKEEYFLGGALPFKKLDKDGDGVITFEEFQKGYDILDKDKDGQVSRAEFMVHFKPNLMHRLTHFAESRHQKIQRLLAKNTSATILRDEMEKMDRKGVDSQTWIRAQAKELQKQLRDKNIAKQRRNVIMLGEG